MNITFLGLLAVLFICLKVCTWNLDVLARFQKVNDKLRIILIRKKAISDSQGLMLQLDAHKFAKWHNKYDDLKKQYSKLQSKFEKLDKLEYKINPTLLFCRVMKEK